MYGDRARIGYTCPIYLAEVFPLDFYRIVPEGVSLVTATASVWEGTQEEMAQSAQQTLRAAREMARAGVNIVVLGGVPGRLRRGICHNRGAGEARPGRVRRAGHREPALPESGASSRGGEKRRRPASRREPRRPAHARARRPWASISLALVAHVISLPSHADRAAHPMERRYRPALPWKWRGLYSRRTRAPTRCIARHPTGRS